MPPHREFVIHRAKVHGCVDEVLDCHTSAAASQGHDATRRDPRIQKEPSPRLPAFIVVNQVGNAGRLEI